MRSEKYNAVENIGVYRLHVFHVISWFTKYLFFHLPRGGEGRDSRILFKKQIYGMGLIDLSQETGGNNGIYWVKSRNIRQNNK